MQQQHLNKCDIIQTKNLENQQQQQKRTPIEETKTNNVCKDTRIPQKQSCQIEPNQAQNDPENDSPQSNSSQAPINHNNLKVQIDEAQIINDKIFNKKLKIKHNKKCSGCLKKHLGIDILECSHCPKSYHRTCLNSQNLKIIQPFLCQNCQEIIKQRQLKKQSKKQSNIIKAFQPRKIYKSQYEPTRKISSPNDVNQQSHKQLSEFAQKYPLYVKHGRIQFPIQDVLLEEFSQIMPKSSCIPKPLATNQLPPWFGSIIQLWNTIQTFESDFADCSGISISELSELMQYKDNLIVIERLFIKLSEFIVRDLIGEKFQNNKALVGNSFLFLLKYCSETGSFSRIYKYVWIQLFYQILKVQDFTLISRNLDFSTIISKSRKKVNCLWMPQKLEDRVTLLQSILDCIVQTNSYHDDLQLKIQRGRQNAKIKNDSAQRIKQIEYQLKDLTNKKKAILKQIREKTKQMNHALDKPKFQKQLTRLENQQKELQQAYEKLNQQLKQQRSNVLLVSNEITFMNVCFLGKDKQKRDYWFVPNDKNSIFVNIHPQTWFQYDFSAIQQLIKSLNFRGVREKQLLQNLQQYRRNNYFSNSKTHKQSHLPLYIEEHRSFQRQKQEYSFSQTDVDFDKQEFISFNFIQKILLLGQKKISAYLQQKSARWGTQEDRESFFSRVNTASTNRDLIEAAKFLNEKICVVQMQYVISNVTEEKLEVNDYSKIRKVQTKMWGINEKYKHAWLQYLSACNQDNLIQVFFLNAILYLKIDRYVSKMRDTRKSKKDFYQQQPSLKESKILNKNLNDIKTSKNFQWEQTCEICKQFGDLLCCDMCPKVFHLTCIGLSEIPQGNYHCKQCQKKRQTRSITKKIQDVCK